MQNVSCESVRNSTGSPFSSWCFFRVLAFLKEWVWENGLFVSLYETDTDAEEKDEDATGGNQTQVKTGAGSGSGVWTISTAEDRTGRVWTSEGPDAVVARRIKMLAKASSEYVSQREWDGSFVPKVSAPHLGYLY